MKRLIILNRYHYLIAIICISIITLSFCLSIQKDDSVSMAGFDGNRYKDLCLFKHITGIPCPSCGLTRGFVAISKLEFGNALHYNIACLMIYLIVLLQIPYRLMIIMKSKYILFINRLMPISTLYFYLTIIVLFTGWFYRLYSHNILL